MRPAGNLSIQSSIPVDFISIYFSMLMCFLTQATMLRYVNMVAPAGGAAPFPPFYAVSLALGLDTSNGRV